MGWDDDYDDGYANGACGECADCGADTSEPWHLYCSRCYGERQGWTTDGIPSPAFPGDERWKVAYLKGYREGWAAAKADQAA